MSQQPKFNRTLFVAGLAGIAGTLLAPQSASAFGHMGGGHGFGGGAHFSGGGHMSRGPSFRNPGPTHLPHVPTNVVDRHPGREPNHRRPPIFIPTFHRVPPIFIPIRHHGPVFHLPIIVRGPVIVRERLPIVRAAVGGAEIVAPTVRPLPVTIPTPAVCATDGSFVSVVFVPTVTAADITSFLKAYNVTMADGPNADGVYRIRLSSGALPQNQVLQVIESMRTQSAIVASVDGA